MQRALLFLVAIPVLAETPPHQILATVPCRTNPPAEIRIARGKCAEGRCTIELTMRREGKIITEMDTDRIMSVPAGASQNGPTGWWFAEPDDSKGERPKTNLSITKGKHGPNEFGVLLAHTAVPRGGTKPETAYEYYYCRKQTLVRAWDRIDDGTVAETAVILKDTNQDGFDDFTVRETGKPVQVFVWSAKSKRFELKK